MSRPSLRGAAALLIAVVCVAFAVVVLTRQPAATAPFSTPSGARPVALGVPSSPPSALFVGDSYTAGYGAQSPQQGYACLTAAAMGWTCNLDAQGGTGFLSDGGTQAAGNQAVPARLAEDRKLYRADVVIVDAGRNDTTFGVQRTAETARRYLADVHAAYPKARLVVITPAYMDSTSTTFPFAVELAARLRESAAKYDAVVLDPLVKRWSGSQPKRDLLSADQVHPSPKGHRLWAKRLTAGLEAAGLGDLRGTSSS